MKAQWVRFGLAALIGFAGACSASSSGSGSGGGGGVGNAAASGGVGATGGSGGLAGSGNTGNASGTGASSTGGNAGDAGPSGADTCGDGQDNDGNGLVDEGCQCSAGSTQDCWSGPPERRGKGICKDGKQACAQYGEFYSWGQCVGEVLPQTEIPGNGVDEDCDGSDPGGPCVPTSTYEDCWSGKDDDCNGLTDCQDPACSTTCNCTTENCSDGIDNDCDFQVDCKDADCVNDPACKQVPGCVAQFPFFVEIVCGDGVDNDCDGKIDCADPDCHRPGDCGCAAKETNCSDGKDEDCDKSTDCADLDCQKCSPGSSRYCDDPQYCHWGKQQCGSDGHWGTCTETNDVPPGCGSGGTLYSASCCVQAGECCQNYPTDQTSIGNCTGVVSCN